MDYSSTNLLSTNFRFTFKALTKSRCIYTSSSSDALSKSFIARSIELAIDCSKGDVVEPIGFREDEALLEPESRSLDAYRLLSEYFAFPERFLYFELQQLQSFLKDCKSEEFEVVFLFDRGNEILEDTVTHENFELFCTPGINLFPKRAEPVQIREGVDDFQIVPERTRPLDFEVYQVNRVVGYAHSSDEEREFRPFYSLSEGGDDGDRAAYYTVSRRDSYATSKGNRKADYRGQEVFLALSDGNEQAPYSKELRQLSVEVLCTNRDLPTRMNTGIGRSDFTLETGAPLKAVRCIHPPTRPRPTIPPGESSWRLINHLSINQTGLFGSGDDDSPEALREILRVYTRGADDAAHIDRQIDGIISVKTEPIVRRLTNRGHLAFGHGVQVSITCQEKAFEGTGVYLFGSILEKVLGRLVSINSFTELVLSTQERGEVYQWPARAGQRQVL